MRTITRSLHAFGLAALVAVGTMACDDDSNPVDPGNGNGGNGDDNVVVLSGQIRGARTLNADSIYVISGFVEVFPGGTLTIPAGTELVSDINSDGSLVTVRGDGVDPSGRLVVQGTPAAPVVFRPGTEAEARAGLAPAQAAACERNSAGGIVLHGLAPINQPGGVVSEGIGRAFGGNDPADDSGDIQYLVVLCSGTEIAPDNEINGVTLAGTGNGTRVSHVQVHLGGDDGFEWFGGTANGDHLVVSGEDDDGFDCDFGWTGTVQFGVVIQDADVANRGVECDNDGAASSLTPLTNPQFWNITWIGAGVEVANSETNEVFLRRNSEPNVYNSIVMNFGNAGIVIDGSGSQANAASGALDLDNILFFNNKLLGIAPGLAPAQGDCLLDNVFFRVSGEYVSDGVAAAFGDGDFVCADPQLTDVNLDDPIDGMEPNLVPRSGSPALDPANARTPSGPGIVDPAATYLGAFGSTNWMSGWTVWVDAL